MVLLSVSGSYSSKPYPEVGLQVRVFVRLSNYIKFSSRNIQLGIFGQLPEISHPDCLLACSYERLHCLNLRYILSRSFSCTIFKTFMCLIT